MDFYKKRTAKAYSFLINNTTLASDKPLRSRYSLLERIYKMIMTNDDKIRYKKNYNTILKRNTKNEYMNILQVKKYYLLIKLE